MKLGLKALLWALILQSSHADASCNPPADVLGNAEAVADFILKNSDVVGIGVIRMEPAAGADVAERIELVIPFKGALGTYRLQSPRSPSGAIVVTSAKSTRTGKADGDVALITLQTTGGFNGIGECSAAAQSTVPVEELLIALGRKR